MNCFKNFRCVFCFLIVSRISLSFYSFKDYNKLTYYEIQKLSTFQQRNNFENFGSLKKLMKTCLNEVFESQRKKIELTRPLSLTKSSFFEEMNKTNTKNK